MATETCYVYALVSQKDGGLYIGMAVDVTHRLRQHNNRQQRSTRTRVPFGLLFTESCANRQVAREREKYYKSGVGREFLRRMAGDQDEQARYTTGT